MSHLLGVDPGSTTGLARYFNGEVSSETMPVISALLRINDWDEIEPFDAIAIERFATAGKLSKYGLETIDLVGQIKGWAYARNVTIYLFNPQSRTAWQEHVEKTPHQDDAKAHLFHLMTELGIPYAEFLTHRS